MGLIDEHLRTDVAAGDGAPGSGKPGPANDMQASNLKVNAIGDVLTVGYLAPDAIVANTPTGRAALAASDELTAKIADGSRKAAIQARGALVLMLDDGEVSQYNIAAPALEAVGGRATFAIASTFSATPAGTSKYMPHAAIRDLEARGHEIAWHSATHVNMTGQTAAARVAEWAKEFITSTVGCQKTATTFVYPVGASSLTTDMEAYLRFDRVFAGTGGFVFDRRERSQGLSRGRFGWYSSTHQQALQLVRDAAAREVTVALFTHSVDGTSPFGVTQTEFLELVALAGSLGVPFLRTDEAYPPINLIRDPGFEDNALAQWSLTRAGAAISPGAAGAAGIQSVTDTPPTAYAGTRSLQMVSDGNLLQAATPPVMLADPSVPHTLSARVRMDKTTGDGTLQLSVREFDQWGNQLAANNSTTLSVQGDWQQMSIAFTPNAGTRYVTCLIRLTGATGSMAYVSRTHLGATRYAVLA
ncbi:polysaccharide deacetylase [Microbacterium laevaniformans OR221]|nr:polysaccharide deacetylase [Microbacterium laevaniformans OR221]